MTYWPLDVPETKVLPGLPRKLGAQMFTVTFNLKGEHFTLHIHTLYTGQIVEVEPVHVHSATRLG